MSPEEHLQRARSRIADLARWTKHEQARDASGARVEPDAASAVCWCAAGTLYADGVRVDEQAVRALYLAALERGARSVSEFNDAPGRTHADVLALYDRAIEIAVERGPVFAVGREFLWAEFGIFCSTRSPVRVVAACPDTTLSSADGPIVVKARDASQRRHRTRANDLYHLDGVHVLTSLPRPPDEEVARLIARPLVAGDAS